MYDAKSSLAIFHSFYRVPQFLARIYHYPDYKLSSFGRYLSYHNVSFCTIVHFLLIL